jgi:hypothetical protein
MQGTEKQVTKRGFKHKNPKAGEMRSMDKGNQFRCNNAVSLTLSPAFPCPALVVVMMVTVGGDGFYGHDAAVCHFALDVFELDRGVVDLEFVAQRHLDPVEDERALRRRNIGDRHMRGECVTLRTEAPDVQVVDIFDASDLLQRSANLGQRDAFGSAFEQDVEGLADDR